jgi:hypothetical protein
LFLPDSHLVHLNLQQGGPNWLACCQPIVFVCPYIVHAFLSDFVCQAICVSTASFHIPSVQSKPHVAAALLLHVQLPPIAVVARSLGGAGVKLCRVSHTQCGGRYLLGTMTLCTNVELHIPKNCIHPFPGAAVY